MASKPICIDISHWQADPIDFKKVKQGGIRAVIFKASQGMAYIDPTFASRRIAAKQAGLLTASYHYLENGKASDIPSQIQHYLGTVDPGAGERMILDVEDTATTLDDLLEAVEAIQADPRALQVTIYSGHVIKELLGTGSNEVLSKSTTLWLAHYTSGAPVWPEQVWQQWSLHQYSDSGAVSGIVGPVDVNNFNGTDAAFLKWFAPATAPVPVPLPTGDIPVVEVIINSDRPVQLQLIVNENVTTLSHSM